MFGFHIGKNDLIFTTQLKSKAQKICFLRIRKEESRHNHNMQLNSTNYTLFLSSNNTLKEEESIELPTETYVFVYSGIIMSLITIAAARSTTFFKTCANASQNLHDSMFNGLIYTAMQFFDENPIGRITNRFTKDLGAVDEQLPKILLDALQMNLNIIGAIIVTIFTDIKLSIVVLVMAVFFLVVRRIFLKCSTNIKRLEGTSRFMHILADN